MYLSKADLFEVYNRAITFFHFMSTVVIYLPTIATMPPVFVCVKMIREQVSII